MWTSCCFFVRKRTGRVKTTSQCSKTVRQISLVSNKTPEDDFSDKLTTDLTANGYQLRNERRSLPDVVITSASIAPTKLHPSTRSSLQFDSETGRRPTLDVETTARLAEAESMGLEEFTDSPGQVIGNTELQEKNDYRSKSLGCSQLKKQVHGMYLPIPQYRASTSYDTQIEIPSDDRLLKKAKLLRLTPLKGIQTKMKKLGSLTSTQGQSSHKKNQNSSHFTESNRHSNDSKLLEDDADSSDLGSFSDRLGQLPSKIVARSSRFAGYSNLEGNRHTVIFDNVTSAGARPGGIRRGSLCIFSQVDEPIVTPFAQILASLRRVRANFILLTNVSSSKDSRFGTLHTAIGDEQPLSSTPAVYEQFRATAAETLEELEWCLERLENIQTHRSVSDMASSKFKKMLNKELSQFTDGGRNAKQISEYICSTFLDSKEMESGTGTDSINEFADDHLTAPNSLNDSGAAKPAFLSDKDGKSGLSQTRITVSTDQGKKENESGTESGSHTAKPADADMTVKPYGVVSNYPKQLEAMINQSLDVWGLDIFELARLTPNPLTCVFYSILQKRGLIKRFSLSEPTIVRYMNLVEDHYRTVPYHNRVHAADVVQSTHVLLNAQALSSVFTDLEVLAVLFACAVHDVDHPGLTNQYLINTNDQLAIMYNDASVLENHHLAVAFQLMNRSTCDLFEGLTKKQRLSLRRMTIDMVLATDMSKHMSLLADLKTMVETKKVAGSGILTLDNYSDRMQILQNMIHCSDLSNPTKPLVLYRQWNARVMEEHFRQGDREREQGLEFSPMCDRTTASIEKTQVSFIDYIVHPLWETWSELVHPDAQKILETLEDNREWYLAQIVEDSPADQKQEE